MESIRTPPLHLPAKKWEAPFHFPWPSATASRWFVQSHDASVYSPPPTTPSGLWDGRCGKPTFQISTIFNKSRIFELSNSPVFYFIFSYQSEGYESKAGPELLDIIFAKGGGYGGSSEQTCTQIASSPPFFSGSPPSRVSNPLIQDALFGDDKVSPVSPRSMIPNPSSSGMSSSSPSFSSARKGGCLRANFGNKPAVRIEGFDCLDRDNRRNCSIPALAWKIKPLKFRIQIHTKYIKNQISSATSLKF